MTGARTKDLLVSAVLLIASGVLLPAGAAIPARAEERPATAQRIQEMLARDGISFGIQDAETLLGNVSGGLQEGAVMQGLTTATLQIETAKAIDLPGGTFNVSALQIHGNNTLSALYLDSIQTANGNAADNATRLWEIWYDQALCGGTCDVKLGQQSIDQEFISSEYSGLFVNTMAGWPTVPSYDLFAGGPAYPLSSLGMRLRVKPTTNITVLAGVFDDNPPGGSFSNDPQSNDASGTLFNLNTGALFIAEGQFETRWVLGLPGTYKLGFWYDQASFPDQAYDTRGFFLTDPAGNGVPAMHPHNYSIYAVADQTVWEAPGGKARTLNAFLRLMGAPPDRNLISFCANGGLTITDPLPGRQNDTAGIDVDFAAISSRAAALDRASNYLLGTSAPIRSTETLIELTYQAQLTPWLQVQPDLQYVINPGGGVANPDNASQRVQNELVIGARTTIAF